MIVNVDSILAPPDASHLDSRESALRDGLSSFDRVAVAFSGGVDSALLLAVAVEIHGDRAVALTAISGSFAQRERSAAVELAVSLGARHFELHTEEVADPRYRRNDPSRCFYCKDVVYADLVAYAAENSLGSVIDGMNADDTADHRPGRRAAEDHGVMSPLFDAGLTKADVRALARRRGLSVWDKPAMACLSSRIPHGTEVNEEALTQVDAAEVVLRDFGCGQVRVRHHGEVARIEVEPADFALVLKNKERIDAALRLIGFEHVSLDLAGYRMGSLSPGPSPNPSAAVGRGTDRVQLFDPDRT